MKLMLLQKGVKRVGNRELGHKLEYDCLAYRVLKTIKKAGNRELGHKLKYGGLANKACYGRIIVVKEGSFTCRALVRP